MTFFLLLICTLLVCCATFLFSLWRTIMRNSPVCLRPPFSTRAGAHRPLRVCVVLGSGGHTSEMLRTIDALPSTYWEPHHVFYVVSASDAHSAHLAQQFQSTHAPLHSGSGTEKEACVHVIPRSREVGQSYASSIVTTFLALLASLRVVCAERPDVLLTNGPGVCVPVVLAALVVAAVAPWYFTKPAVVYFESFTCVSHLSLTGKLLAPYLTDVFTVQWHSLHAIVSHRMRRGKLFYCGVESIEDGGTTATGHKALLSDVSSDHTGAEKYAVVTVGSTRFDTLVENVVGDDVKGGDNGGGIFSRLQSLGITRLYVQHGTGPAPLPLSEARACGVSMETFNYRPNLGALIQGAALVITHAGAGTILECLHNYRPAVVVPNRKLMSDHQLELAYALQEQHYVYCVNVEELASRLPALDLGTLRVFPGVNCVALARALAGSLAGGEEPALSQK